MPQSGSATSYGIPVFDREDVRSPYLTLVDSTGKRNCFNLVPNGQGDRPCVKVRDSNGTLWQTKNTVNQIIDDFEDGAMGEYGRYNNEFQVIQNARYHGSRGLRLSSFNEIWSKSGLNAYPLPGKKFDIFFRINNMGSPEFWYGTTNGTGPRNNHYQVEWFPDADTFQVRSYSNGNDTKIASTSVPLSADRWYRIIVWWRHANKNADHAISLREANTDSEIAYIYGNNLDHADPLFGFGCDDNMSVDLDYGRVLVDY